MEDNMMTSMTNSMTNMMTEFIQQEDINMENLIYDRIIRESLGVGLGWNYRTSSFGSLMVLLGVFQLGLFLSSLFVSRMYTKYKKYCCSLPEYKRQKHYLEKYGFTSDDFERKNDDDDNTLKSSCIVENTPNGTVHMSYDKEINTFIYWSNTNIPTKYLEVVARKFAKTFHICHLIKRPLWDFEEEERLQREKKYGKQDSYQNDDNDDDLSDWSEDILDDEEYDNSDNKIDDKSDDKNDNVDNNNDTNQNNRDNGNSKDNTLSKPKSLFVEQKKYNKKTVFSEDNAESRNHFRRIGTIQELYETMNHKFMTDFNKNKKSHTMTISWKDWKNQQNQDN